MANKLRSFLEFLLGVTIGIFCIIGVKSAVNSLEDNIRNSMSKLGNDVIYIDKFSGRKTLAPITGNGCAAPIFHIRSIWLYGKK